ncbi:hypothetical protein TCAL_09366 [Tigriopus californicus]|uniref:C2H2-type domain-containing protein n=1 Tax=Tigriopus californicus TaxID=6832 RepID=A0A553PDV2_TIGCA|nr:zinc finger protein 571-like [Tigriopus californicus]XP_059099445.1 zinc finger protein 571-like [Tigriopus californicus]TRY75863.1 hypothetical protein TCAL_09366 [Tigriopus californicus]|eukprot:TCALIF_09366-PA protein Name:"Similar to PRDM5 PR domain zinc finger protein 5 (Homo sapiens)" AED:0.00 eAED:0.00 QI:156/1/1/1/1/1/2/580/740
MGLPRDQTSSPEPPTQPEAPPLSSERPQRRTRNRVNYRDLNERGLKPESVDSTGDDEDADAARDVDEVLDEAFRLPDPVNRKRTRRTSDTRSEDERDDPVDEDEVEDVDVDDETIGNYDHLLNNEKFRIKGKRTIRMDRIHPKKPRRPNMPSALVLDEPYEMCKDQICVVCSQELLDLKENQGRYKNLYRDTTKSGKSLFEIFRTLVKQEVQPTFYGSYLCKKCVDAMENIETLYRQYRRATEGFLDTFVLGQKILDADTCLAFNIEEVDSLTAFLNLKKCTLKVLDPADAAFNALAIGYDFGVELDKTYLASVKEAFEIPVDGQPAESADGVITLTFDASTGVIEKTTNTFAAEIPSEQTDVALPQIFVTKDELAGLTRTVKDHTVHFSTADFDALDCRLFLGAKLRQQILLSKHVAEEYQRQIPGASARFSCSECTASYDYFHMLSNHIQSVHCQALIPSSSALGKASQGGILNSGYKTNEMATLEKPFQCEYCNKCFQEYVSLSMHVDHYHGFHRVCNIEQCNEVFKSIQEFVQHYASHAAPNIEIPTGFKEKTKIVLPCPLCNINIQGVWKYFQHTFTHDKEARFKCPACHKRMNKVQSFKDHIYRHSFGGFPPSTRTRPRPKTRSSNAPTTPAPSGGLKSEDLVVPMYKCSICSKCFLDQNRLKFHEQVHIPRDQWEHSCGSCHTQFPSLDRLKIHVSTVHNNVFPKCQLCDKMLPNRHELRVHLAEVHNEMEED